MPELPLFFDLPAGTYVVGYTTDKDPEQSSSSMATIAWVNTFKANIQVIKAVQAGFATVASFKLSKGVPYPTEGQPLYLANATTAQDPVAVWQAGVATNTAQHVALGQIASQKADIAAKTGQVAGKLASETAKFATDLSKETRNGAGADPFRDAKRIAAVGGVVLGLYLLWRAFR